MNESSHLMEIHELSHIRSRLLTGLDKEKANDRTQKDEFPRLVGARYAKGDQWRNNSRKNMDGAKAKTIPSCGCD